jgi:hypothetical protein
LALRLEPLIAAKAKANQLAAQNNNSGRAVLKNSAEQIPIETRKEVAAAAGVSHDTIAKTELTHNLTHQGMDAGRKSWTLTDGIIR